MNYANRKSGDSYYPYEVTRVVSLQTLEIREMAVSISEHFRPEWAFDFCLNTDDQRWVILRDPRNPVFRIRRSRKGDRTWRDVDGNEYVIADAPKRWEAFSRW